MPIDFDGNVGRAIWYEDIPGLATETEKEPLALENGEPSENIIGFIEKSFNYTRRNRYMWNAFWITASVTAFLIILSVIVVSFISFWAYRTQAEANAAKLDAINAVREANTARAETNAARVEADRESERAKAETLRADDQARIADAKTREANEATKLANEQKQKADAAESQRIAAENRKKEADRKAAEQEYQAKTNLAENYYNIAEAQAQIEPIKSLPWLQKAIETAPESSDQIATYKLRLLQAAQNVPYSITNTGFVENYNYPAFSPELDKIFLISRFQKALWDVKRGVEIRRPIDNVTGAEVSPVTMLFSPNGKWLAAFTVQGSPGNYFSPCLNVWEVENVSNYWQKCDWRFSLSLGKAKQQPYGYTYSNDQIPYISFSPDSAYVLANVITISEKQRTSLIWDVETAKELKRVSSGILPENPDDKSLFRLEYGTPEQIDRRENFLRRNNSPISKNKNRDLLISYDCQLENTILRVTDIPTGSRVGKEMVLEKYVDFVDFSGDARHVISVSHAESGKNIRRVWDLDSENVPKAIEVPSSKIIAINGPGNRIFENIKGYGFAIANLDDNTLLRTFIYSNIYSISAQFSDEENVLIAKVAERPGLDQKNFYSIIFTFDIRPPSAFSDAALIRIPARVSANCQLSASGTELGLISNNGVVSRQKLLTGKSDLPNGVNSLTIPHEKDEFFFPVKSDRNFKYLLVTLSRTDSNFTIINHFQFWDLEKRVMLWDRNLGLENCCGIETIFFMPDNLHFVAAAKWGSSFRLLLFDIRDGSFVQLTPPIENFEFDFGALDITGTKLIVSGRSGLPNNDVLHQTAAWDLSTGLVEYPPLFTLKQSEFKAPFSELTRYGEYMLFHSSERDTRYVYVLKTSQPLANAVELTFATQDYAWFAKSVLLQAEKIDLDEKGVLTAEFSGSTSIEFVRNPENIIRLKDKKTGKILLAPTGLFNTSNDLRISPDARLVAVRDSSWVSVWSTRTGFPLTPRFGSGLVRGSFIFSPDSTRLLTVSDGSVDSWYIGSLSPGVSAWIKDIGAALTGLEIGNSFDLNEIPQEKLVKIRNDYIKRLQEAADSGDVEAKYILDNLKP